MPVREEVERLVPPLCKGRSGGVERLCFLPSSSTLVPDLIGDPGKERIQRRCLCFLHSQPRDLIARFSLAAGSSDLAHHRPIELLHEYRTRLIAAVVTGKLDVRKMETNLPDRADARLTTNGIIHMDQKRVCV